MKKYLTEYELYDVKYSFYCIANSKEEADSIVRKRGLNEKIIGESNIEINKDALYDLMHEICFLGYIAIKSGNADIDDILSDKGVLHESIHLLDNSFDIDTLNKLEDKIMWLHKITNTLPRISHTSCIFKT
jgi:hypothetical protein